MKPLPCPACGAWDGTRSDNAPRKCPGCLHLYNPLLPTHAARLRAEGLERPIPESGMLALEFLLEPGNWPEGHEHTLEPWKNVEYAMKKYSTPRPTPELREALEKEVAAWRNFNLKEYRGPNAVLRYSTTADHEIMEAMIKVNAIRDEALSAQSAKGETE